MITSKKPNKFELAKEAITQVLSDWNRIPWCIVKVSLPGKIAERYASFDPVGIELFEYSKKGAVSIECYEWSEWKSGEVDHFLTKSVFTFRRETSNWLLETIGSGKEAAAEILKHNVIPFNVVPRIWFRKILGFRSGNKGKMIFASIVYLSIFSGIVHGMTGGSQQDKQSTTATSPTTPKAQPQTTNTVSNTQADAVAKQKAEAEAKANAEAAAHKTAVEAQITISKFDDVTKKYNSVYDQFHQVIQGLSNGTLDPVTAYTALDLLHKNALIVYSDATSLQIIDRYSKSKETMQLATSYLENSIKEIQQFLDDKKTSTMAKATEDLTQSQQAIQIMNLAIAEQAIKDGYQPPSDKK